MYKVRNPKKFDATPELGMGYHFGVMTAPGARLDPVGVIVLNAQYALPPSDIGNASVFNALLRMSGKETDSGIVLTTIVVAEPAPTREIVPSDKVDLFIHSFGPLIWNVSSYASRKQLHSSPPFQLLTKPQDSFVRFSAFHNDRRVRPNGSLLAGTYVTSERDAGFAPSGFAVVGRYALPNMMPAVHRFDISLPTGTAGLVGTVTPAFGQAGGGVEIEFTSGTPPGSVTRRSVILEY